MAFTLFCREFGNVVNRAFLVLIFGVNKFVGANFTRFCNYGALQLNKGKVKKMRKGNKCSLMYVRVSRKW